MKWWNPQNSTINAIEGQAWQGEHEGFYDRLPTRAKSIVRPEVWARSKFSSGLTIRFKTNSPTIQIRYKVGGKQSEQAASIYMRSMGTNSIGAVLQRHSGIPLSINTPD
ncbi:MAG: hypothetical protein BHV68_22745 [Bacteroidales bacterium 43_8]|nr:MAG: hypothetical protein BHV68_22745 [Bacteroidales bacterium 43_8]